MAIDIRLMKPRPDADQERSSMSLENEAHYWFLWPLIDALRASHGKYVDLYGDVAFRSSELPLLEKLISDCKARLASSPPEWQQHCGVSLAGSTKTIHSQLVRRGDLELWLEKLASLVELAREVGSGVEFSGD
ncbi:MAG: hypothetical protein NXI30_28325 [bacterium]|nr:hypothetical protein [bacterium]